MELKLNVNAKDPVVAESSARVPQEAQIVFSFIADDFHKNYMRWMTDVIELDLIDPTPIRKGNRLRQVRVENEDEVTSTFEIKSYDPFHTFALEGLDMPYRQTYSIDTKGAGESEITFRFELLEIDLFMRPFVKLIRSAMEEGVDSTLETLVQLISTPETRPL